MGWEAELPHQFVLAGDIYDRVAPNEALPNRELWYDVGRGYEWRHRITLENYLESVPHWKYPRCLDGAGASPSGAEKTFSINGANRRLWRHPRR